MPDESVPQIKLTNQLLKDLIKDVNQSLHESKIQSGHLERGFNVLQDGLIQQTSTLSELQIITKIAELASLQELLVEEEVALIEDAAADSEHLEKLAKTFQNNQEEIENLREKRVRDLLQPIYQLMEHDLQEGIEKRLDRVASLLEEAISVNQQGMELREYTIQEELEKAHKIISELVSIRLKAQTAVASFQHSSNDLSKCGSEGTGFAIPCYIAEFIENDGKSYFELIPPSIAVDQNSGQPTKQLLRGKLPQVGDLLNTQIVKIVDKMKQKIHPRTIPLSSAMPKPHVLNYITEKAWNSMLKTFVGLDIELFIESSKRTTEDPITSTRTETVFSSNLVKTSAPYLIEEEDNDKVTPPLQLISTPIPIAVLPTEIASSVNTPKILDTVQEPVKLIPIWVDKKIQILLQGGEYQKALEILHHLEQEHVSDPKLTTYIAYCNTSLEGK